MARRALKTNSADRLVGSLLWSLIIYTSICSTVCSIVLKPGLNDNLSKTRESSAQLNITKFQLNPSLDSKSTYSSLAASSSHFTSSSSSSSASSSSSSSSSESQANEDVLATSDVSLGAQVASNALLIVSDELIDSGPETRTDRTDNKLDKNKLLIELTTEVNLNLKQTTSISDNLSVNDVLLREDDYLHQHLEPNLHAHHLLNDYLIADLDKSTGDFKSAEFKSSFKVTKSEDKLNNEPISYSSSNRPLDTGHAVFTPIQPPPPNTIDLNLDSSQPNIPDFNYPLDFSSKNLNNKMQQAIHQKFNSSVHSMEEPQRRERSEKVVGVCRDGLVISAWRPLHNLSGYDRFLRGLVYFFALCYLFVGVSIIADR